MKKIWLLLIITIINFFHIWKLWERWIVESNEEKIKMKCRHDKTRNLSEPLKLQQERQMWLISRTQVYKQGA